MNRLLRAVALVGLLLLPIQMRAGAASPHPHALLQLLLDASDGTIDHHLDEDAAGAVIDHDGAGAATDHHARSVSVTRHGLLDIPAHGTSITATAGLAVLTVMTMLAIPAPRAGRTWPPSALWRERRPVLEPPPPRLGCV